MPLHMGTRQHSSNLNRALAPLKITQCTDYQVMHLVN